ncbi:hypothetical protein CHH91_04665 [Virgibacillus sp. 7505]|uniref:hypothetical protein n=1 Tax=Virgibacillus sp. 7505 TaxID=2022548 RepID=UPI000BA71341|nr:hypothetical protein [Virgibacillus sp. 7505]PAE17302.1 hypothetical protein CHH91_04665 [Virgibacillus sp. 7505]
MQEYTPILSNIVGKGGMLVMWMKNYVRALNETYFNKSELNLIAEDFKRDIDGAFQNYGDGESSFYSSKDLYWEFPNCAIKLDISGNKLTFTKSEKENAVLVLGMVEVTSKIDRYHLTSMESFDVTYDYNDLDDVYYEAMKILLIN